MFGLAALVLFILAAIGAFTHLATTLFALGLIAAGLACMVVPVAWPSFAPWRRPGT